MMASAKDTVRRQKRRELDARRSKSRVRLGSCQENWGKLKDKLGFSLHSELAQFLLESYFSKPGSMCFGSGTGVIPAFLSTSAASLHRLVLLVHNHGQQCPLPPTLLPGTGVKMQKRQNRNGALTQRHPKAFTQASEVEVCLKYVCEGGHEFSWCPKQTKSVEEVEEAEEEGGGGDAGEQLDEGQESRPSQMKGRKTQMRGAKRRKTEHVNLEEDSRVWTRSRRGRKAATVENSERSREEEEKEMEDHTPRGSKEKEAESHPEMCRQEGSGAVISVQSASCSCPEMETDDHEHDCDKNQSHIESRMTLPTSSRRGSHRREDQCEETKVKEPRQGRRRNNRTESGKEDMSQTNGKKRRSTSPKLVLPCEFDGCWKTFSSRRYLNHHMKYQHVYQKTFICSHPSCGKSFNFKKHLKEHEKVHSDQRDYICEFCARAFRTTSSLIMHRRIHTGEKPLQCEVCGFTCRQKASLNWHMRKHDAESSYLFPCDICGRRFEKRDNVKAHQSKSHSDHKTCHLLSSGATSNPRPQTLPQNGSPPTPLKNHVKTTFNVITLTRAVNDEIQVPLS